MEHAISNLVGRYERGLLSRRQLIHGLALLAVGSASSSDVAAAPVVAATLDHVSLQAKDVQKTADFYKKVFGLPVYGEDPPTKTIRLRIGAGRMAIRQVEPYGVVDHFCISASNYDKAAITESCKQIGVQTYDTGEPLNFHVVDPDGYPVQILSNQAR
jgi:catechol 2,3-dioxygenase-like lactoylglutathione lyase family enzyme